jgi:HEAT repeat protein
VQGYLELCQAARSEPKSADADALTALVACADAALEKVRGSDQVALVHGTVALVAALANAEVPVAQLLDLLVQLSKEGDGEAARQVVLELDGIRTALDVAPVLVRILSEGQDRARVAVLQTCQAREPLDPRLLPGVIEAFRHSGTRRHAGKLLRLYDALALDALGPLIERSDGSLRSAAITLLCDMAEASTAALPLLARYLSDDPTRGRIERLLLRAGPAAIPALEAELESPQPAQRWAALKCFVELGEVARGSVPKVARCLETTEWRQRDAALEALAALGPEGRELTAKIWALAAEGGSATNRALQTLARLTRPEDRALLVEALDDADRSVRERALAVIQTWSPKEGAPHRGRIVSLLGDDRRNLGAVAKALGAIGGGDPTVVDALEAALLGETSWSYAKALALALVAQGDAGVDRLISCVDRVAKSPARAQVYRALGTVAPERGDHLLPLAERVLLRDSPELSAFDLVKAYGEQAVPLLRKLLRTGGDSVQRQALQQVSRLGPAAAAAVPELRWAAAEGPEALRARAAKTLAKVAPAAD